MTNTFCPRCRSDTQKDERNTCLKCHATPSECFKIEINDLVLKYGNRLSKGRMEELCQELFETLFWEETINSNRKEKMEAKDD